MQIGKTIAAHHQLVHRAACLQNAKGMHDSALHRVDVVRETTLQCLAPVIQALLRVAYTVQQLARKQARATLDLPLKIDNIGDDQLRGGTRRRRAQVCDEIGNREIDFVTDRRDSRHGGMKYGSCDNLFVELP